MKDKIIALLEGFNKVDVENYANYCVRSIADKKKDGTPQAPYLQNKTAEDFASYFKKVNAIGLVFDGKHISIQSTGITFDYVAYKNKMLLAYPESKIDIGVVVESDVIEFSKDSGRVTYSHKITDPFNTFGKQDIIGAYCVIKNNRGEFLTLLDKEEITKHRNVAKQDYIWANWYKEMVLKTVIKKACKQHFDDVYEKVEEIDNENYDINIPILEDITWKEEIDAITTVEGLKTYWEKNKGQGKDFDKYVTMRRKQIENGSN